MAKVTQVLRRSVGGGSSSATPTPPVYSGVCRLFVIFNRFVFRRFGHMDYDGAVLVILDCDQR